MYQNPRYVAQSSHRRYLSLLCTKAFNFNRASKRENAPAEFQISEKNQDFWIARAAPSTRGMCIFRWSFGNDERLKSSECTYLQESCVRDRRIATRVLYTYLVLFYFWSPSMRSKPVTAYRSRVRSTVLMRLFCAFQLIPLRERQADVREEAGWHGRLIQLVPSGYGRRDHFAGIFSSCITELINTRYTDTRNCSTTSVGITDTTQIVYDTVSQREFYV